MGLFGTRIKTKNAIGTKRVLVISNDGNTRKMKTKSADGRKVKEKTVKNSDGALLLKKKTIKSNDKKGNMVKEKYDSNTNLIKKKTITPVMASNPILSKTKYNK
jgi:rhamnose utilization protein RhaD (predicted bifunctional aldolase and dehydrogenase)